jgi:hypothetical protein
MAIACRLVSAWLQYIHTDRAVVRRNKPDPEDLPVLLAYPHLPIYDYVETSDHASLGLSRSRAERGRLGMSNKQRCWVHGRVSSAGGGASRGCADEE